MKTNVGGSDKIIRILLGIAVIVLGIVFQSWWGVVGVVFLFTGVFNFCPIYSVLGVSTKPKIDTEKK